MIMPSKDKLYNGRKGIGFKNPSYFCKAKELRPSIYDERVIRLGYTPMFLTHSDEALEIEKFKRARENKIEFAYDYGNLNEKNIIIGLEDEVVSLLEKEKENLEIIESLKSKGFESSENAISESKNQSENDCQVVEKGCDNLKNSKVIATGMFKINVSQSISPILVSKTSCASNNVENKTKRKRRKRTSSKQNDKQVNNDVLHTNRDFVHSSDLDTLSSVIRPKHSGVIWKKKGSSNTSNVDLSSVRNSKLNKDVKRYSHKDLLSCNNSHHVDTRSAYACNDAMNVSCNSRLYASYDANDLFVFDDIVQIYLWIIDLGCSNHMTGNIALLTNFVEKFLGMVRFGNNDFVVIAGYEDVGLEVSFRKSSCFVRTEDGVDLLNGDHSLNLYTIALNDIASNSSACLPKMKFKKDHLCSACEQGKIHWKHHKSKTAFASSKPLYLLHMDLCGPMRVESINGKRYVLVVVDDYSRGSNSSFIALIPKVSYAKMVKDFRPISLLGSLYKIIAKLLANHPVHVLGDIVNEVQYAFVANRQILDGPFIINEAPSMGQIKTINRSMIFKVDYREAYNRIDGNFLDDVLKKSLVLVQSGVVGSKVALDHQDVRLCLHISVQRVVDAGIFKGIAIGYSLVLSHMFYADDAVFLGQWSDYNIDTIVHVLE
ncbi:retrovirus-related pol polyprotein from transposon TNT 1-94 [Tanacetum coccineum]